MKTMHHKKAEHHMEKAKHHHAKAQEHLKMLMKEEKKEGKAMGAKKGRPKKHNPY